jgi:pyrroloquinoline quinone biosynthesis protein B
MSRVRSCYRLLLLGCGLLAITPLLAQKQPVQVMVLGVMQDAGLPQLGCTKLCCAGAVQRRAVSSLAVINSSASTFSLLDATPDIVAQCRRVQLSFTKASLQSIYLTHAHMGHYTGLLQLGREAMNTKSVQVYALPRMASFIQGNGPWSQLVRLENIKLKSLQANQTVVQTDYTITPILVPHRDEFSETVGYKIQGPTKSLLFIPDIDKWSKWDRQLMEEIESVDYAFLDGTFFAAGEVDRPMQEIPHPFIQETVALLSQAPRSIKERVYFIHFNHTNPLINARHPKRVALEKEGFHFAKEGTLFSL